MSVALQLFLLLPNVLLLIGASRRLRFLLLPWLTVFGLLQVALLAAVMFAVMHLPKSEYKVRCWDGVQVMA